MKPDTKALKTKLQRSADLATGLIPGAGRSGDRVGPYVCATVELRVEDMRDAVALCDRVEALEAALTATRIDVGRLIDALINQESLHEDECPEDDTCSCELVKLINATYERLQEWR